MLGQQFLVLDPSAQWLSLSHSLAHSLQTALFLSPGSTSWSYTVRVGSAGSEHWGMPLGYGLSSLVHGEGLKDVIDSQCWYSHSFSMALSPTVMIGQ